MPCSAASDKNKGRPRQKVDANKQQLSVGSACIFSSIGPLLDPLEALRREFTQTNARVLYRVTAPS